MDIAKLFAGVLKAFFHAVSKELSEYHTCFIQMLSGEHTVPVKNQKIISFLELAYSEIVEELSNLTELQKSNLKKLYDDLQVHSFAEVFAPHSEGRQLFWSLFSTELVELLSSVEGNDILLHAEHAIDTLRETRKVKILSKNQAPLKDPARQILFTSNILLTTPLAHTDHLQSLPRYIVEEAQRIAEEEKQLYWYDHPMPIGVSPEANEMLYGLQALSEAFEFEKTQGTLDQDAIIQVLLSVSVTHAGLSKIAKEYLQFELNESGNFPSLEIYILTERETQSISSLLNSVHQTSDIDTVFGVDGRYGRHYSLLKAIAPLWKLSMNENILATFKIDLDQVFPQEILVKETGKSALEHFKTDLWGAIAEDNEGKTIELGMIAGALVNEADISQGLFTPDIALPTEPLSASDIFFPRIIGMAISTRAEMMTKYGKHIDPTTHALQRIHVTGGTNGILISSLMRHRPFTPSFIGRAEDQAYLMSVYNNSSAHPLRYLHSSGLIMRHDKAAFAGEAIKAAKLGTYVGDLLRTLLFSAYGNILHGGLAHFKTHFSPFTSCFSSETPVLSTVCRLLLHCLQLDSESAHIQLELAAESISEDLDTSVLQSRISAQFASERLAWDHYYDSLETLEENQLSHKELLQELMQILESCKIQ